MIDGGRIPVHADAEELCGSATTQAGTATAPGLRAAGIRPVPDPKSHTGGEGESDGNRAQKNGRAVLHQRIESQQNH